MRGGATPQSVLFSLMAIGLLSGIFQVIYGALGLGRLIKYMPYPVVSGYLTGVGLIIVGSQVPKLLGVPNEMHFWQSLLTPGTWQWQGIVVGLITAIVMVGAERVTKMVPAVIAALAAGVLAYFGLGLIDASLLTLQGNSLVVGPMTAGGGFTEAFAGRIDSMKNLDLTQLNSLLMPA